jgi:haloalkane dehalogenase
LMGEVCGHRSTTIMDVVVSAGPKTGLRSRFAGRNVMPHLQGLGRLVAADMIGMCASDKLSPSGPDRYNYAEQRDYLFALWDALDLGGNVTLVLHDWGSALGFDWASQHRDRVRGIAFMEAMVTIKTWPEFDSDFRELFQRFRSAEGERLVLEQNIFVEGVLPGLIQRQLSAQEMITTGSRSSTRVKTAGRRCRGPGNIPTDGEPANVDGLAADFTAI